MSTNEIICPDDCKCSCSCDGPTVCIWTCTRENDLPEDFDFVCSEDAKGKDIPVCPYYEKEDDDGA